MRQGLWIIYEKGDLVLDYVFAFLAVMHLCRLKGSREAECWAAVFHFFSFVVSCRDTSVGIASDWRSEGSWFKFEEFWTIPGLSIEIFNFPFFYFQGAKESVVISFRFLKESLQTYKERLSSI